MKPSEYKWSEWIRATWRSKVFEWKAGDFFGDEWADGIATLEAANAELLEALGRVQDYSRQILDGTLDGQDELDPGWAWRVCNDAIRKHKGE